MLSLLISSLIMAECFTLYEATATQLIHHHYCLTHLGDNWWPFRLFITCIWLCFLGDYNLTWRTFNMEDFDRNQRFAKYKNMKVDDEKVHVNNTAVFTADSPHMELTVFP